MNVHGLASSAPDILGTINGAMNLFTPSMYPGMSVLYHLMHGDDCAQLYDTAPSDTPNTLTPNEFLR